jgi:flagellar FliJ protein
VRRFAFNLETFLDLRKNREHETELELARAIGLLTDLERRIKALAEERFQMAAERFSPGREIKDKQNYELYILRLDTEREGLLEECARAELEVEKARAIYTEAARERNVVDKLKEKKFKEYKKEMNAAQAKILDDISSGAAARERIRDEA